MNKTTITEEFSKRLGISKKDSIEIIDTLFDIIAEGMLEGKVTIMGFGTFKTRITKDFTTTHPVTKKRIFTASRKSPMFSPSKYLRKKLL